MAEELVITPGGLRPRSMVHHIEPGTTLDHAEGRLRQLHASGETLADFGELHVRPGPEPLMPANVAHPPAAVPSFGTGWITYSSWTNGTGTPVSSFSTTWVVPPAPSTSNGQIVFLFNGIQNSTMIYQPVLQWGTSAAGGGAYWSVASWYADGQGGQAFHSNLVRVNPGDVLVGVMTKTGQSPTGFSYNCEFQGIANSGLPIQNVQELTWCIETLECYGITACSDYPAADDTAMGTIDLQTGTTHPTLSWTIHNDVTDCGQHTTVPHDGSSNGEVDLFYRVPGVLWAAMGGAWPGQPGIGSNADGRIEVFLRGNDANLYHIWQTAPSNGWSGWAPMGGSWHHDPVVARNADGRMEVFVVGDDTNLYHIWQTAPNSGWSGWAPMGGSWPGKPAVGQNADGRLEVFLRGNDANLYHIWQTAPSNGWSGWAPMGGSWHHDPVVARNADGRMEVFVVGDDTNLYHIWQTAPNSGWSGWAALGGTWHHDPVVINNADGRMEVFVVGNDTNLYHIWQTAPNSGWSGWAPMGGSWPGDPGIRRNADGRIEVFLRGNDANLYHIWQTAPNNGWSGWAPMGGSWHHQPVVVNDADARLEVFVVGDDTNLYHAWQTAPSNGWAT